MIEERCVQCGVIILGATRKRFERNYTNHVVAVHGRPETATIRDGGRT